MHSVPCNTARAGTVSPASNQSRGILSASLMTYTCSNLLGVKLDRSPADKHHNLTTSSHASKTHLTTDTTTCPRHCVSQKAMHRLPHNRALAALGGVITASFTAATPPSAAHEVLACARGPAKLTSFCPLPSKQKLCSKCWAESDPARLWLPYAGRDRAWAERTGSGPIRM